MAIKTNIKLGDLDLLSSQTILAYKNYSVEVNLDDGEETVTLYFQFEKTEKKEPSREVEVIDDQTAAITFVNYDSTLGTYPTELWEIGDLQDRKLYLGYVIYGHKEGVKKLDLNFYLGEGVEDG